MKKTFERSLGMATRPEGEGEPGRQQVTGLPRGTGEEVGCGAVSILTETLLTLARPVGIGRSPKPTSCRLSASLEVP